SRHRAAPRVDGVGPSEERLVRRPGGPQAGAGPGRAAGRQVRRAGTAEQERGEDRGQAGVDLGELEVDGATAAAAFEVVLDARGVATRQAATDVSAEVVAGPAAV